MARNKVFNRVKAYRPKRSVFDLSYEKKFTCDMGQLIPVVCDEMVPGDKFYLSNEIVMRMQPLVAPILHSIDVYVHYFFVPYRLLFADWETFITRGIDGNQTPAQPVWQPTKNGVGTLWDYFGFPIGVSPAGAFPVDYPRLAYNLVYNEYYRDETLMPDGVPLNNEDVLYRAWEKDYFTSALPFQQRGTAPALPISGFTSARWDNDVMTNWLRWANTANGQVYDATAQAFTARNMVRTSQNFSSDSISNATSTNALIDMQSRLNSMRSDTRKIFINPEGVPDDSATAQGFRAPIRARDINANTVDLSRATTFDVNDLRLAFQIQKWMERNARSGARYTEFLRAHFGVAPRDERLQRPQYIGGSYAPVIISEVLKTSTTDNVSPQGNMAGHGISVARSRGGSFFSTEYGLVLGLMSIMPRSNYMQGINRQWLRRTSFDYYSPEFAHLSEQGIEMAELYATNDAQQNTEIFGFQSRFSEMRFKPSLICGELRQKYSYWHLARIFATKPLLNSDFVLCKPDKRIFAVQNEPGFIVSFGNNIKAIRPLPVFGEPGFIDH